METAAVDFETFYSKDVGIETQGIWHYCRHPEFDAYLVTISTSTGLKYCGRPENFDWSTISGENWRWVSHNRSFDKPVYESLVEHGKIPAEFPHVWDCTADLSAFLAAPRNLKGASAELLGAEMSKDTRNKMKGRRWEDMDEAFRREVEEYAIKDADYCLEIWQKYGDQWPEHEQWLSRETTRMCVQGVPINKNAVRDRIEHLKVLLWEAQQKLPWVEEDKKTLSPLALAEECRKVGILPPPSLAEDSDECEAWEKEHGEKYPWVAAMRQFRKCNGMLKKLQTMEKRTRPDGWMSYGLKYHGATTGRDSGDAGLNLQNLNRGKSYDVDIRSLIEAPEGMSLVVADLAQIEPRCLAWLSNDLELLDFVRKCPDLYEAQARAWGFWSNPEPLKTDTTGVRHLVKTLGLGLGYGLGVKRFAETTGFSIEEAQRLVQLYRRKNPKVGELWKRLENNLRMSVARNDAEFFIELPSGRKLVYREPNNNEGHLSAKIVRGGQFLRLKWWGGSLTENCLSGETQVLTQRGWIKMSEVELYDRIHDGIEFVTHQGLKDSGVQEVVEVQGVRATGDHLFLTRAGWVDAKTLSETNGDGLLNLDYETQCEKSTGVDEREPEGHRVCREQRETHNVGSDLPLREQNSEARQGTDTQRRSGVLWREMPPVKEIHQCKEVNARDDQSSGILGVAVDGGSLQQPQAPRVEELRRERNIGMQEVEELLEVLGRHGPNIFTGFGIRSSEQQCGLLAGQLPLDNTEKQLTKQTEYFNQSIQGSAEQLLGPGSGKRDPEVDAVLPSKPRSCMGNSSDRSGRLSERVYDIVNCGPRHRFVVRAGEGQPVMIAHNCVQAMARDVFMHHVQKIREAGLSVIMRVHDEVVCCVHNDQAEDAKEFITQTMSTPPEWAKSLPLAAEAKITRRYEK